MKYDRALLLQAEATLQKGVEWVCLSRADKAEVAEGGAAEGLALLHSELCYAVIRVRVKLATTVPQPGRSEYCSRSEKRLYSLSLSLSLSLCVCVCVCVCCSVTPEPTMKPSSLQKKVRERQAKMEQHQLFLASLSAQESPVQSLTQLRLRCGSDCYQTALLAMLSAAFTHTLKQNKREALAQVTLNHPVQYGVCNWLCLHRRPCHYWRSCTTAHLRLLPHSLPSHPPHLLPPSSTAHTLQ